MSAWLIAAITLTTGVGGTEAIHLALHYRVEVAAMVLAVAGWIAHRIRRRIRHTGRHAGPWGNRRRKPVTA